MEPPPKSGYAKLRQPLAHTQSRPSPPPCEWQGEGLQLRFATQGRTWAYSDGSCKQAAKGPQCTGAGIFVPSAANGCPRQYTVDTHGEGVNNTINYAELMGILGALLQGHTDIAPDSLTSICQVRNMVLWPMTMEHHIHRPLLATICEHIKHAPGKVRFFKVKAHSGVYGNECADVLARWAAEASGGHDMGRTHTQQPFEDTPWLQQPPTKAGQRPMLLPNLQSALAAHMHTRHHLGGANQASIYYRIRQQLVRPDTAEPMAPEESADFAITSLLPRIWALPDHIEQASVQNTRTVPSLDGPGAGVTRALQATKENERPG